MKYLPGVNAVLNSDPIREVIKKYGSALATHATRSVLERARDAINEGAETPEHGKLEREAADLAERIALPALKEVVNATGVVIHTNLGRSPLGARVLRDLSPIVNGYSNLEFDLQSASRGSRHDHVSLLLKYLTGAEDALVVNNNTAGLILALGTLASGREVIISRGELIEIGGSFRLPEIMEASGATMVEVGTTNKTRIADFEKAITEKTALLMMAHRSNFAIRGFTEEVSVRELASLAVRKGIPFLYDLGSGLLRKPTSLSFLDEPDVRSSLADGADLVLFSGDKLLGGPQSGIVAGKEALISRLKKAPLMRALRVGKLTLAALTSVMRSYLNDESLMRDNPVFSMLSQSPENLKRKASKLADAIQKTGVECDVVESAAQCGGGTLPDLKLDSFSVRILFRERTTVKRSKSGERVFAALLALKRPVLGVLRAAELHLDVLTLNESDFPFIASALAGIMVDTAAS
ncbi:MAG: L-seryl-tRNA(Sec) selenium transferase [Spirochaetes bacterium]|nr:L-seryl-tRNA(Sec) selenium transferase [Spirochaetota bacterium]